MSKEADAVLEALRLRGMMPDNAGDVNPELEMESLADRCITELLDERTSVRVYHLRAIRRTLRNTLSVLIRYKAPQTIGAIKRNLDPRYRQFLPMLLTKLHSYGIVTQLTDKNLKITFVLNDSKVNTVLHYLEKEKKTDEDGII